MFGRVTSVLCSQFQRGVGSDSFEIFGRQGDDVIGVLQQVPNCVVLKRKKREREREKELNSNKPEGKKQKKTQKRLKIPNRRDTTLTSWLLLLCWQQTQKGRQWVVCSTPHALSPDALSPDVLSPHALSPHTLSTDGLSENLSYSEKLWIKFGLLDVS